MIPGNESAQHRKIKLLLVDAFKKKGWVIKHIDGEGEETDLVKNADNLGDGDNKKPDIDAKDEQTRRIIRGEVKIDNGDFDSEHSITQYKLFSNRSLDGVNSWLIIGVPLRTGVKLKAVLARVLSDESLEHSVAIWEY